MKTVLAIDIGNTSVGIGLFSGSTLRGKLKVSTTRKRQTAEYRREIEEFLTREAVAKPLDGVVVSSVVPGLEEVLSEASAGFSGRGPLILTRFLNTGLTFDVDNPDEVGTDRIANAVAAREMVGDPVLVADFGTATTITAVKDGRFMGGAILSGIGLMAEALHGRTPRLPYVHIEAELALAPLPLPLGKGTTKCIVSGIIYGTAGAVDRIADEIEAEVGAALALAITGGYAEAMAAILKHDFRLCPDLTLHGLRIIFERNA